MATIPQHLAWSAGATALALTALALTAPVEVRAQRTSAPPDFSVNGTSGWLAMSADFVPVPGFNGPGPMTNDPRHPYVPNGVGRQPTYRIADLSHPALKPWVKTAMQRDNEEVLAGKIGFTPRSSCMPAGVPGFINYGGPHPYYLVQTPNQVHIIFSGDQQVRRVYLDVPHLKNPKPSWYGESVGHYEGDTLVIDTIGLNDKTFVDYFRTPHTEKLHVVERWRMVEDGNVLEAQFVVDDPDAFTQAWAGMRRFRRVDSPNVEEVCAENNDAMLGFDYHIPKAEKPDF
jgi:hypothetical protein